MLQPSGLENGFKKPRFFRFLKNLKNRKVQNLGFLGFFILGSNFVQMILNFIFYR